VSFIIFLAGYFRKISLQIFELDMLKIFIIFPNIFDQKSQKNAHDFSQSI
jgi:hypothetical protein